MGLCDGVSLIILVERLVEDMCDSERNGAWMSDHFRLYPPGTAINLS